MNGSGIEPGHYAKKILVPRSISISSLASALTFYFRMTYTQERSYLRIPCMPPYRRKGKNRKEGHLRIRVLVLVSRFAYLILPYSLVRLIGGVLRHSIEV